MSSLLFSALGPSFLFLPVCTNTAKLTSISNSVHYKLYPDAYSHPPSRTGPVMRFLYSLLPGAARRRERVREAHRLRAASTASSAPIVIKNVRAAGSDSSMGSRYDEEKHLEMEHGEPS